MAANSAVLARITPDFVPRGCNLLGNPLGTPLALAPLEASVFFVLEKTNGQRDND